MPDPGAKFFGRRPQNRTVINGFGDRRSTIELLSRFAHYDARYVAEKRGFEPPVRDHRTTV